MSVKKDVIWNPFDHFYIREAKLCPPFHENYAKEEYEIKHSWSLHCGEGKRANEINV